MRCDSRGGGRRFYLLSESGGRRVQVVVLEVVFADARGLGFLDEHHHDQI